MNYQNYPFELKEQVLAFNAKSSNTVSHDNTNSACYVCVCVKMNKGVISTFNAEAQCRKYRALQLPFVF